MKLPVIHGLIERRVLLNYRVRPALVARLLPRPFEPLVIGGHAIMGVCLIRLSRLRPRFWPGRLGLGSENAALRTAVQWKADGQLRQGVYVSRRETNSRLNALLGGRAFPGVHHLAKFHVHETADRFAIQIQSGDDGLDLTLRAHLATTFPATSVFGSLDAAAQFFKDGSLGYSATRDPARFDGMELTCATWPVDPLAVDELWSSYFDDRRRFPSDSLALDCALLMRNVEHVWRREEDLCCAAQPVAQTVPRPAPQPAGI